MDAGGSAAARSRWAATADGLRALLSYYQRSPRSSRRSLGSADPLAPSTNATGDRASARSSVGARAEVVHRSTQRARLRATAHVRADLRGSGSGPIL